MCRGKALTRTLATVSRQPDDSLPCHRHYCNSPLSLYTPATALFSAFYPTYILTTTTLQLNTLHPSSDPHTPPLRSTPHPSPRRTRTALVRRHIPPETASESSVSPRRTLSPPFPPTCCRSAASPVCTQLPLQARNLTRLPFKHDLTLHACELPPTLATVRTCLPRTHRMASTCPKLIRRA